VPPSVPALPSHGGPKWFELSSEHFVVWTDGEVDDARPLVQRMEHLRQVIYGVSFFQPPATTVKYFVIALRNIGEVHAYVPEQFAAYAMSGRNPLLQPVIVLPLDEIGDPRGLITHELTHTISFASLPVQPHWFAEGLANYFETVQLDERAHTADVGIPIAARAKQLRTRSPMPVASLISCDQPQCMDGTFYATTWALISFLANQHADELTRYVQQLATITSKTAPTGWPSELASEPLDRIDHDLANWLAYGRITVNHYKLRLADYPIAMRSLGDADALAARAVLHSGFDRRTRLPSEVDQALISEPTNVIANVLKNAHGDRVSLETARAVVAAHAGDWRAWWLLQAIVRGDEAATSRAKVCELVVKNPAMLPSGFCP